MENVHLDEAVDTKMLVTGRDFEWVMRDQGLLEADIKGKTILSLGEGLSDFAEVLGNKGVEAYAVDPVYDILSSSSSVVEFSQICEKLGMHVTQEEERFFHIKKLLQEGKKFFSGSSFDLHMLESGKFDLIIFNTVISVDKKENYKFLGELFDGLQDVFRVLKPDGEVRFGSLGIFSEDRWWVRKALENLFLQDGIQTYLYTPRSYSMIENILILSKNLTSKTELMKRGRLRTVNFHDGSYEVKDVV